MDNSTYRLKRVIKTALLLVAAGLVYFVFIQIAGFGIPCLFYTITGWKCPGCGVTHMCTAILQLDFRAAFAANPVIFSMAPLWFISIVKNMRMYIRDGSYKLSRVENVLLWFSIVILLAFGVVRNI